MRNKPFALAVLCVFATSNPATHASDGSDQPCAVQTVSLNTGFDHAAGALYPVGAPSAFWTVVDDPDAGTTEPRPATVINPNPAWQPALPGSGWISAYPTDVNSMNGAYDLETTFCLAPEWRDAVLDICLRADDWAEVYLNGVLIGSTPNPSFNTGSPTCITETDQSLFQTGANTLTVRLINTFGVAMGLNLTGQVSGTGLSLEDPLCCLRESSLSGRKMHDVIGSGNLNSGVPLAGWSIELADGGGTVVATTTTDINGFYYFMNLPAGVYTVSETQQAGWAQTVPAGGGGYTVTLNPSQSIGGLDFGNTRCVHIDCAPGEEGLQMIPCEGPDGTWVDFDVIASSFCGDIVSVTCTPDVPGLFPPGQTLIECVAVDSEGNTAVCNILINIVAAPWHAACPQDEIHVDGCAPFVPDLAAAVALDPSCWASTDFAITQDPAAGTSLTTGIHPVTVTITGPDGVEQECVIDLIVGECCETDTVSLNTGYDHTSGGLYPVGAFDGFWTVVDDPDTGTTEPRPAAVISPHGAWQPALPDSAWISAYPSSTNNLNGPYDLEMTFCLLEGWTNAELNICLRADDWAEVYLNGVFIGDTPNPSFNTASPTCIIENDQNLFQTGTNTLTVRMINSFGVAMGLNLAGQITADGLVLEKPECCQTEGGLSGRKFHDVNGNGVWDPGEPVIQNWPVLLSNGATTTTDSNGYYYFNNLPPGTYTVSEGQQPGWTQTAPPGGTHTVTLTASQFVGGLDFGNTRVAANVPPVLECPRDVVALCESPLGTTVNLTASVSDADGDALDYEWLVDGVSVSTGTIPAGGPPTVGTAALAHAFFPSTSVVTLIVTDSAGNQVECAFTVTLVDREDPVIRCPEGVLRLPTREDCHAILPEIPVHVWDNCTPETGLVITQSPAAGTPLPPGTHTVVVTVTDAEGNSASCTVEILVVDATPPQVFCPHDIVVEACEGEVPNLTQSLEVFDDCGGDVEVWQVPAPGTVVGPGTQTITIYAQDAAGNLTTCLVDFTVNPPSALVEPIGIFHTGVDSTGTLLPGGAVDPHYILTTSADPAFPGPDAYVSNPVASGNYVANNTTSQWISPRPDANNPNTSGVYVYTQTFTLPPNMTSAAISGRWATDNSAEIRLNGVPTGDTKPASGFMFWTNFTITGGFVPGTNTIEFVVNALPSSSGQDFSTGLRVEMGGRVVSDCDPPCEPVFISQHPASATGAVGGSAVFSVTAGGSPVLNYQWFHNGAPISGAVSPTLVVSPLTFADSGLYSVTVTNDCGEAVSRRARLRVRRILFDEHIGWRPGPAEPFDPFNPPSPLPGDPVFPRPADGIGYIDDGNEDYSSTRNASVIDSSDRFGLPRVGGRSVPVLRFERLQAGHGYKLEINPAARAHTFVFDVLVPSGSPDVPLLHASSDSECCPTTAALSLRGAPGDGGTEGTVSISAGKWSRVAVTVDPDPADNAEPLYRWFIDGAPAGQAPLPHDGLDAWTDTPAAEDPRRIFLFADGRDGEYAVYIRGIQWRARILSDLEIAALGGVSEEGIPAHDLFVIRPPVAVEYSGADGGGIVLRWRGEGFRIQESGDLQIWEDSLTPPQTEIIDNEIHNEWHGAPAQSGAPRFFRLVDD